jgi:hypothetical protein
MSSSTTKFNAEPLDLSKWRNVPFILMVAGAVLSGIGALVNTKEFLYGWLLSFMLFLSLGLGALFLVLMHHLFDAGWSVPIRRFCEHISTLLYKVLPVLFIPIALGQRPFTHGCMRRIPSWIMLFMRNNHCSACQGLFRGTILFCHLVVSFEQTPLLVSGADETGAVEPTYRMRVFPVLEYCYSPDPDVGSCDVDEGVAA